nr:UBN2 domain-containing protein [Tanacetum cinerariifolium]
MTNPIPAPTTDLPNTQDITNTFNTTISSLKALDEGFSSKSYVRKFLRVLHPKWRAKVTTIKESKDLSSLALDELIGNLKKQRNLNFRNSSFEQQFDDLKKILAKNNEAKMVLYNALPKKEYERIFMCKTDKDIQKSLLITHKALDEGFSSKSYVRKFLRVLHPKWRAKVTTIEESKDLSSLALDELIGNLKVHEVVMEKDFEIYRDKKERIKSIALKAKKESCDDETSTFESDDE